MVQIKVILIMTVLVTLSDCVDAADEKHGMVTKWGRIVDPDRDCEFRIGDDSLSIRFGEGPHALDAETDRMNSPRVVHSIDGDFSVQVTVDGNLPLPDPSWKVARAYISGALVVMQDDRNYIRLERASFTRNGQTWHYANFEQRVAGRRKRMGQFNDFALPADGPVQLKFEVRGDQVRGLARRNNEDWHEVGNAVIANRSTLLVGVSGVKTAVEEAEVHFRELRYAGEDPTVSNFSSSMDPTAEPKQPAEASNVSAPDSLKFFLLARDIQRRSLGLSEMAEAEQSKLISDAIELAVSIPKDASATLPMTIASGLAGAFVQAQKPLVASRIYRDFADSLKPTQSNLITQQLRELANRAEADAKRIGIAIELEGTLIDGKALDWKAYNGKIVLIDFWASWSAPHSAELPAVKDLYEKYREQGFEIVGICLDQEREKGEAFIEIHEIPWATLFSATAGWEHPMATRFDVRSVPTAILVDRAGKIVSTAARGDSLRRLLSQAFDSARNGHQVEVLDNPAFSESDRSSNQASETAGHGYDESHSND